MRIDQVVEMMARNRQHRLPIHLGVVQTIEQVHAAGAGRGETDSQPTRVFGIGARHQGRRFLMPHLDEPDAILPRADRFHDSSDAIPRQAKNDFDAPLA